MRQVVSWLKEGLLSVGFALLAVISLVAFIVLARPLMIVVAVGTVGAVVLSCISPRFLRWFEALGERRPSQPPAMSPGHHPSAQS